jgi:hypothetical protein
MKESVPVFVECVWTCPICNNKNTIKEMIIDIEVECTECHKTYNGVVID